MAELNALVAHLAGENLSLKQQLAYYMGKAMSNPGKATATAPCTKRKAGGLEAAPTMAAAASPQRRPQTSMVPGSSTGMASKAATTAPSN
eukprot:9477458-Pyramimonas_sp.AAC.2